MISKAALRAAARARRAKLAADLPDYAGMIARQAADLDIPGQAIVASFWPQGDEADPRALAQALGARGHKIVLPCVAGADQPLVFRLWRAGDALRTNAHGVQEPLGNAPVFAPAVVLVPLLAFDEEGFRLGYGGGYYDRSLAELRALGPVVAIGIAYAGQETASLPREAHDQPLDGVVTERGVRHFART